MIIPVNKPVGKTPLEMIHLIKELRPEIKDEKISYAGRLDPMAEGLLILISGEKDNKNRKKFERLEKTYEFEVLFGFQSDSYDILGMAIANDKNKLNQIDKFIRDNLGEQIQEYPPYSAAKVNGKPLFYWARKDKLDDIEIPSKNINIYKFEFIDKYKIDNKKLLKKISKKINAVNGDFRQEEILKQWQKLLEKDSEYVVARFEIECSGGTYVRSLANKMGGLAIRIYRTKVGDWDISDVIN